MADIRSTYQLLKDRKKMVDNTLQEAGSHMTPPVGKSAPVVGDKDDLLSPAVIEAEYQRQKAAKKKKGWW
jgi:hypothetical protein